MTLTPAQIASFAERGYLLVRGLFDAASVAELRRWTAELEAAPERPDFCMVYGEPSLVDPGKRIVQRIENFCPFHPAYDRFVTQGRLGECVDALFGERAVLFKDKINLKLAGGDGFKPHQDQQAGWSRYASLFITALVAIDDATLDNGCLHVAAGPRLDRLIGPEWRPLEPGEMEGRTMTPIPTLAGDALFFDSYVAHASEPNFSQAPRRVLYVTYNRASEGDHRHGYFADKRRDFPPDIERELGTEYVFRV
jgi:ectoine hydroxylase-related dioxygenase (phytanoyl-CoA dioxygenase family)